MKRYNWRHFFGGVSLLLIFVQFFSGLVLAQFYTPHLDEAYASIQAIYNQLDTVAWLRDLHRWGALFILVVVIMHFVRSFLRKDYLNRDKKTFWLTGVLLFLPMLGFLITGFILPWEWRAYWFMGMAPNYVENIAFIGPPLKDFLINEFTINRDFIAHVLILPVITAVLIEFHAIARIRKRKGGIPGYIKVHSLVTIPFILIIACLAYYLAMPSQDPEMIPMPLEGTYIPAPEWFVLIFFVPYMHFKGFMATFLSFYLPFIVFLTLAIFPYYLRRRRKSEVTAAEGKRTVFKNIKVLFHKVTLRKVTSISPPKAVFVFLSVSLVSMIIFGSLYAGSYESPTMGCNSCHNINSGIRMGVPPATFKDREINPLLDDKKWMMEHWYYPQVVW